MNPRTPRGRAYGLSLLLACVAILACGPEQSRSSASGKAGTEAPSLGFADSQDKKFLPVAAASAIVPAASTSTSRATPAFAVVSLEGRQPLARALEREVGVAKSFEMRPFLYVHAPWCPPCVRFERSLAEPEMQRALTKVYLIRASVDHFSDFDFQSIGMRVAEIPAIIALDRRGMAMPKVLMGEVKAPDETRRAALFHRFFQGM